MLCCVLEFFMWLNIIQDMREPQIFPCDMFGLCDWWGGGKYYGDSLIAVVWYVFSLMLAFFEAKDGGLSQYSLILV